MNGRIHIQCIKCIQRGSCTAAQFENIMWRSMITGPTCIELPLQISIQQQQQRKIRTMCVQITGNPGTGSYDPMLNDVPHFLCILSTFCFFMRLSIWKICPMNFVKVRNTLPSVVSWYQIRSESRGCCFCWTLFFSIWIRAIRKFRRIM